MDDGTHKVSGEPQAIISSVFWKNILNFDKDAWCEQTMAARVVSFSGLYYKTGRVGRMSSPKLFWVMVCSPIKISHMLLDFLYAFIYRFIFLTKTYHGEGKTFGSYFSPQRQGQKVAFSLLAKDWINLMHTLNIQKRTEKFRSKVNLYFFIKNNFDLFFLYIFWAKFLYKDVLLYLENVNRFFRNKWTCLTWN